MKWTIRKIILCSFFITFWTLLASSMHFFRPLFYTIGFVPVFYILIWLQGWFFPPKEAFITGFLGHAFFDFNMMFDFFFVFIWLASGFSCLLISLLKRKNLDWMMIIILPIIYSFFLLVMGYLKFFSGIDNIEGLIFYIKANPILFFMIVIVDPIFNLMVWLFFIKSKIIKKFFNLFKYENRFDYSIKNIKK